MTIEEFFENNEGDSYLLPRDYLPLCESEGVPVNNYDHGRNITPGMKDIALPAWLIAHRIAIARGYFIQISPSSSQTFYRVKRLLSSR